MGNTQQRSVRSLLQEISILNIRITNNKNKINAPDTPASLKKDLIDDNNQYLDRLKELNQELDKWKK